MSLDRFPCRSVALLAICSLGLLSQPARAQPILAALTPPMGWNSYDAFGDSVTEAEFLSTVRFVHEKLLPHGWKYVVVDYRWYDPGAHSSDLKDRAGAQLTADKYGRLLPALNRFPSAPGEVGFRALADQVHAMGLLFGIHVMRGIPRQAVRDNTPIDGSPYHARDAAMTENTCSWCPDMYGVKGASEAGQAWYDSIIRLYASWGVDLVKVDDLSQPYSRDEIHAIRTAISRCGRAIVFSTSPGETAVAQAADVASQANMWRISSDFWDRWSDLDRAFDLVLRWKGVGGPGHWPDADMLPLSRLSIRCFDGGPTHWTRFTHDEQVTLLSLWAMAPSPLMLGGNLPESDQWTVDLLTNDEVLAINQDSAGRPARLISPSGDHEIWVRDLADGSTALAVFNRSSAPATIVVAGDAAGLNGKRSMRDVWAHRNLGDFSGKIELAAPPHGSRLLRLRAQ